MTIKIFLAIMSIWAGIVYILLRIERKLKKLEEEINFHRDGTGSGEINEK